MELHDGSEAESSSMLSLATNTDQAVTSYPGGQGSAASTHLHLARRAALAPPGSGERALARFRPHT
jgi:hypothetical protein